MFNNSKEFKVKIGQTDMDYVVFGKGEKPFIIIPGLGDGLRTVKGTSIPISRMYKLFAKEYKVFVFSRKSHIQEGYSTRDMARDLKKAMDKLDIKNAHIMGISQGGMISQYLAIDYPEVVDKLVIGVSASKQNGTIQQVVNDWISMAKVDNYKGLIIDTLEKTFTENKLKKYKRFYPILTRIGKPKSFNRFIIQANSCLNHNDYDELKKIKCPTLVIGGDSDKVVGKNTSEEMAERISQSKLIIYKGLGHGAYEEAKDFNQQVLKFFLS